MIMQPLKKLSGRIKARRITLECLRMKSLAFVDIFRDSRVAIVVTRMDDQREEVRESERLSDERVKQIVSEGIKTALDLDFVSPDIVFPVSGKLAFQVNKKLTQFFHVRNCHLNF